MAALIGRGFGYRRVCSAVCMIFFAFPPPIPCAEANTTSAPTETRLAGLSLPAIEKFSDDYFSAALDAAKSPGALLEIVDSSGTRWEKGYGRVAAGSAKVPDPKSSYFRIASETKFFTAIAVMQLVERGRIRLDDDAEIWLGGLTLRPRLRTPVTIRSLLQHTSGVSNIPMVGAALSGPDEHIPLAAYLEDSAPVRLRPAGEVSAYTNGAFTLLGRVVEVASGMPYERYMREHVLTPLGMERATFILDGAVRNDLMPGTLTDGGRSRIFIVGDTRTRPSGDLITTAHEMGNFLQMMLNHGAYGGDSIVKGETLDAIYSDCFAATPLQARRFCLGVQREDRDGFVDYSHGGDHITYKSAWWVIPRLNIGIWVGHNSNVSMSPGFFDAFVEHFLPTEGAYRVYPARVAGDMSEFAGYYRANSSSMSRSGRFFDILPGNDDIRVSVSGRNAITINDEPYIPIGPHTFQAASAKPGLPMRGVASFLESPASGNRYLQNEVDSATLIPWYLRASINRAFAIGCLGALALAAVGSGFRYLRRSRKGDRVVVVSTILVSLLFGAAAWLLYSVVNADYRIVWEFPVQFRLGRVLLYVAVGGAAGLLLLVSLRREMTLWCKACAVLAGSAGLALSGWAFYWQFI